MSVRNHRIVAASILVCGIVGLTAWGRSMAVDSGEIQTVRARFQGAWAASFLKSGVLPERRGTQAEHCIAVFDGKAVRLQGLVGDIDAIGTFYIEAAHPGWIDLKLDAGWIVGLYRFQGENLELCLNPFAPPERLGIPTLPRPRQFDAGEHRNLYVFRRAGVSP